jgi:lipoprotein-anchoring transpeptidase ErfK/SrfK
VSDTDKEHERPTNDFTEEPTELKKEESKENLEEIIVDPAEDFNNNSKEEMGLDENEKKEEQKKSEGEEKQEKSEKLDELQVKDEEDEVEVEVEVTDEVEVKDELIIKDELGKTEELEEKELTGREKLKETVKDFLIKNKKTIKGIIIVFCVLIVIYFGMAGYFIKHFYFGTEINNIDVSGKTIEEVEEIMESELQSYTINLKERGGKTEQINAGDIGLKYSSDKEFINIKNRQNPYKWISGCLKSKDAKFTIDYDFNKNLLKEGIDKLSCFDSSKVIEPQNPSFKYVGNSFNIIDEVLGNKVDKNILYTHLVSSIQGREYEIDLDSIDCYIKPKYNSKSRKVLEAKDFLNKYVATKVTYIFGEGREILDGNIINKWLKVDDDFKVTIDEEKIKEFVQELSKTYNTVGKTRSFKTPSGKSIKASGGDYGWSINKDKEAEKLTKAIKQGITITREPEYNQKAFSYGKNDIGNTFVEIDLAKQHIWFYKNGKLIVDGPVVTGNVSRNHTTPKGIYRLKYKAKNVVLRGPDYAAPVTFWMPFNGGIGMHDANWRGVFGGKIYRTNGSHGCINCPYNVAKAIYNNIEANTPIICH